MMTCDYVHKPAYHYNSLILHDNNKCVTGNRQKITYSMLAPIISHENDSAWAKNLVAVLLH